MNQQHPTNFETESAGQPANGDGAQYSLPDANGPMTVLQSERAQNSQPSPSPQGQLPKRPDSSLLTQLFPSEAAAEENERSLVGIRLEHFQIEQRIGSGGMGAVFRAMDERLERIVALKVLAPKQLAEKEAVDRFHNEARAAAQLDHENIARIHTNGEDQGLHYIAFEYITGPNLRELILRSGRLKPADAVNYTLQIALALKHLSAANVVHRDIKPSNIIITPAGRAKLVDLGLARKDYNKSNDELTVAGTTLGTFDYISPEQAKDPRNVDVRSDIYSLGCTLYHMLTGEPPYPDGTFLQRLLDHQDKKPPNPATIVPSIPPALAAVVQKMMANHPKARHASADELIRDLVQVAAQLGLQGTIPSDAILTANQTVISQRFWQRHFAWIVSAVMLLVIAIFAQYFPYAGFSPTDTENGFTGWTEKSAAPENSPKKPSPPGTGDSKTSPDDLSKTNAGNTEPKDGSGTLLGGNEEEKDEGHSKVTRPPQIPEMAAQPFSVKSVLRTETKLFSTLESACTWAQDSDVILLNFDGTRLDDDEKPVFETPIKIFNKKITIRAGNGRRPRLEFTAHEIPSEGYETRMISVSEGSVDIFNVDFIMHVDPKIPLKNEQRWTLFSAHEADRIQLEGGHISVINSDKKTASIIELTPSEGPYLKSLNLLEKMTKLGAAGDGRYAMILKKCFLYGHCQLFRIALNAPGRIEINQSAIAVEQPLLGMIGEDHDDPTMDEASLDFKLEHVTCLLGQELIHMESGEEPRTLTPIYLEAKNCLFAAKNSHPLIRMTGKTDPQTFLKKRLFWSGANSFYDGFKTFWIIASAASPMETTSTGQETIDLPAWKKLWQKTEVGPQFGGVAWKNKWRQTEFTKIPLADFQLDTQADPKLFPAGTAANDGSAVGVDQSLLYRQK